MKNTTILGLLTLSLCIYSSIYRINSTHAATPNKQSFEYNNTDFQITLPKDTKIKQPKKSDEKAPSWTFLYIPTTSKPIVVEIRVPMKGFSYNNKTGDDKRNYLAHFVIVALKALDIPYASSYEDDIRKNITHIKLGANEFLNFKHNVNEKNKLISSYSLPSTNYVIYAFTDGSTKQNEQLENVLASLNVHTSK